MYKYLLQVMDENNNWSIIFMTNDYNEGIDHLEILSKSGVFYGYRLILS
jgi:hypothetical protein